MQTCELELPWPPTINHSKIVGKLIRTLSGKLYQPRVNSLETKQYYCEVWAIIQRKKAREGLKSFHSSKILALDILAYPPDAKKRDTSNILKVLEDSLQRGGLFKDDYQIARHSMKRMSIIPHGKVVVRVSEIDEEPKCT